ncbi:unnamed protein product [Euphydryas editha]|uniref:Endonuclease-reverse transcriptase n=1 Tax=Euphydryas editha TaxID=104508 RepID=A0AAU9TEL9_EUPED|nr:unnamed protein product [Euphydryas editha]
MDEVLKALLNIQKDIAQQKQDMIDVKENIKESKESINKNIDEKFDRIEAKTKQLEEKIEKQQNSIDFLEKQMRKKNIVFFGISESEKNYEELLNNILHIINEKMNIACPKWEIESVFRLGRNKDKIRPVVVTTTTLSRKLQILKNKRTLDNSGLYIKQDYTPAVLIKRRELQDELQRKRMSGEKVTLRYDKIVEIKSNKQQNYSREKTSSSKTTDEPRETTSNKRFMSESPDNKSIEKTLLSTEQTKQVPKRNKPQNITNFLRPAQLTIASKASTSQDHEKTPKN